MSHYAVISPPLYSHMRALEALAQALIARGHRITFVNQAGAQQLLHDPRIGFCAVGEKSHPPARLQRTLRLMAHPAGPGIIRLIKDLASTTDMLCHALPAALTQLDVDGVIVDQMEPAGGLAAEALGLPFVSVACALPVNRDETIPLPVMPFRYARGERRKKLYRASTQVYDKVMARQNAVIAHHARRLGLPARNAMHECLSPLAHISQTLTCFDFPRQLPGWFHAVGPLRQPQAVTPDRPTSAERPLIFASLGTLQGHRYRLFRTIARACRRMNVRLLIAHCGGLNARQVEKLIARGAEVTDFADQTAVMRDADVVVTHGGMNTVMDAINSTTPILVIPLAFDQPGVAARVEYQQIGRRVSRFASSARVEKNLRALLADNRYAARLAAMQQPLQEAGGAPRAAQIVELALTSRQPVMAGAL
ncbi:glycosyltransferase family 1 protein [Kosakonia sp. SMBL-WEM22]|uniref:glycosyltransferase n=1 Tax=Kosakonia sp. SMBL-WEM22 TaxID=2725560 RepID=UPI0016596C22|nr:glycosyltransferase [Kosakonia sp. SMBL-WEM22]QNQ19983.1 glycosyltransferase family 1 protein [Kosakonia sp. SMBL-WEM22]